MGNTLVSRFPMRVPVVAVGNRVLRVFQGAVGAFSASTAPAASIGRRAILASNDVVPFVEASNQDAAEMNRPDPVGDLLEADRVLFERIGDEEQSLLEAKRPSVGDALHQEVPGILNRRQLAGVGPRWRAGRAIRVSGHAETCAGARCCTPPGND